MRIFKLLFHRPIYRRDILKYALKHYDEELGMCAAIQNALWKYGMTKGVSLSGVNNIFGRFFNKEIAFSNFNAYSNLTLYWWSTDRDGWKYRKRYFKWLIERYEHDDEDLRYLPLIHYTSIEI